MYTVARIASLALGIATMACSEATGPAHVVAFDARVQPLITATSAVTGAAGSEMVQVSVVVTNPDDAPRQLTVPQPCLLSLRLYATPARTGTPVYSDGLAPGGCKSTLYPDTLDAHASITYRNASSPIVYAPPAPTGQRLPPGRYYASVNVGIVELTPGTTLIPVGEVVLAAP
jgi:hypothetical protein